MKIRKGTIEEVAEASLHIPELHDPYKTAVYHQRLGNTPHLILVAEADGKVAGFKVGYDRYKDGSFYSWMGGLLPAYRSQGIYQELTATMEQWASENGYTHMLLKTRNKLKPMIRFCLSQGYYVSGFSEHPDPMESRIYFRKELQVKSQNANAK
ncbi:MULTISPECIES: GNAT family N-acetyltransferase [unclassified Imperialibacter]|uniref:GNAT family N-acetyltransferase n=1 Tax=unclassified Imperialibacter TaxID=2629706 RepID=UPI0012568643|nr:MULTISPECIES: GNAT family N-acetyltransferase [unclassified Imperialibacter]CAD5273493.1 GNAT family acetyltransferase [Imperialibacter sp. 75]CAD5273903.1 GNAT family acetyltransferase [Imperialibacter sp. 89]VVT22862.1 GNAT family acetyltransferase [Imperialibacter sp. EC-SDR9]